MSTSIFYTFIASLRKKIRDDVHHTTHTHKLIRALRDGGRLVRCYTQNIDGLEARDGLCTDMRRGKGNRARFMKRVVEKPRPAEPIIAGSELDGGCEVVQLHGDLDSLRCGLCNGICSWDENDREAALLGGDAPECLSCSVKDENRRQSGKRGTAVGALRPNVVLYGEEHPAAHLLSPITTHDLGLGPDVLLILGTSLRVHGLKVLVKEFAKAVHARGGGKGKVIFVNRTKPPESIWSDVIDYWVGMDCDRWVSDLKERRPDLWEHQGMLKLPVVKDPSPLAQETELELSVGRIMEAAMPAKPSIPRPKQAKPRSADDDKENAVVKDKKMGKAKSDRQPSANRASKAKQVKPRPALVKEGAAALPGKVEATGTTKRKRASTTKAKAKKTDASESIPGTMLSTFSHVGVPAILSPSDPSRAPLRDHYRLPTPPSSQGEPSTKRSFETDTDGASVFIPSKRKCLQIWVDNESELDIREKEEERRHDIRMLKRITHRALARAVQVTGSSSEKTYGRSDNIRPDTGVRVVARDNSPSAQAMRELHWSTML